MVYLQSSFDLTNVACNHVTFESDDKPVINWITAVAAHDSTLYIGDSSGQLSVMNFTAVDNQKKVLEIKILFYSYSCVYVD